MAVLGALARANYDAVFGDAHGCRVAMGQRALDTRVDDHLGCLWLDGASYSVRERSPFKETFDPLTLKKGKHFEDAAAFWGAILATDHARADRSFDEELVPFNFERAVMEATDGARKEFRDELEAVSLDYAARVASGYAIFVEALADGALE